jgi:uncharacterized membrane protein YfcA
VPVTFWQGVLVLLAGMWAGTINTVVGSGTLVSFPVLLSVGLPPLTANITNTVGLFPGSLTGAAGYRRELVGQGKRLRALLPVTLAGAITGALLLLVLPPGIFKAVVPVLIALALVLVVFGSRINKWLASRGRHASEEVTPPLRWAMFGTGIYGGYFGAAQGILQMGLFGVFLKDDIQRQNGLKNVLTGLLNFVSAVVFIAAGRHIDWAAAALLAVGAIAGGLVGARIGRRLSPPVLRAVIVVVGLAAIAKLLS